jgi:hypothetical protein
MGCTNAPFNVGTLPQSGGWYVNAANQYPLPGFIFVTSPLPPTPGSYGLTAASPGSSCLDIYNTNANTRTWSGTYFIVRSGNTIPVYCDMLVGGGGWTLVAMIASSSTDTTWSYDSVTWTSASTINPSVADIAQNVNMKNLAYSALAFTNVRLLLGQGPASNNAGFVITASAASAAALFSGGTISTPTLTRTDFMNVLGWTYGPSVAATDFNRSPNCNAIGLMTSGSTFACRFGIAMNNENDCASCDAWCVCVGGWVCGCVSV